LEPNFNHSYWSIKRTILIWNSLFTIIITFPCIYCSHILCNEKLLYETCVEVFNFAFKFSEIYCELNCSKSRSPFLIGRWKRKKMFHNFFLPRAWKSGCTYVRSSRYYDDKKGVRDFHCMHLEERFWLLDKKEEKMEEAQSKTKSSLFIG
jgi:hypothetical protein